MPSQEILGKLFDIEKKAEDMVLGAKAEAAARIAAAADAADAAYHVAYESALRETAAAFDKTKAETDERFQRDLLEYQERLKAAPLDRERFDAACEDFVAGLF